MSEKKEIKRGRIVSIFKQWNRSTVAGAIGNTLEWYDFAVYGYFAPVIAKQFFPADDEVVGLIATFGVFAAGFLMRPIGGLVLGHVADKVGRGTALNLSIVLMAVPTTLIAITPTFEMVGIAAPIILTLLRLLQGISVGGEYTGSVTYLVESAPRGQRGIGGSFGLVGSIVGFLLGSGIGSLITGLLTPDQLAEWGWRIPFALGIILGLSGFYLRANHVEDQEDWSDKHAPEDEEFPIVEAVRSHGGDMLRVMGINVLNGVGFFVAFVYLTTYLVEYNDVSATEALALNTAVMVLLAILVPTFGYLSDKVGRKPVMLTGALSLLFLAVPMFWLLHQASPALIILGQLGLAVSMACFTGPLPTTMTELFPAKVRVTAYSVAFNIPLALFGGTAPMVAQFLINRTHDNYAPAFYAMVAALIASLTLLTMRETSRRPLR